MTPRSLKSILIGAALVASAAPGLALAGTTCVYVIGQAGGKTVTTPAIPIVVPASEALTEPVRVHLDETAQNIIGYSLAIPGLDAGTEGTPLFSIPEINQVIPGFSVNIPLIDLTRYRCVDASGVTVPAIPYYIPGSAFSVPGGFVDVGAVFFNLTGREFTVPGKLLTFDGKQVIIPTQSGSTSSTPVSTPDSSVTLNLDNASYSISYLKPVK
ncbi:hypothetical protein [Archangium primigenium]|uniref:hypothetical protein n=1 Tax=[Archangium] primigenium TaxID=2792470 RepID=UPI00195E6684|nr:hypothetical protein [Archangium primigenium]MBM7111963.1 hypothetical protein [Archangium primigenium]